MPNTTLPLIEPDTLIADAVRDLRWSHIDVDDRRAIVAAWRKTLCDAAKRAGELEKDAERMRRLHQPLLDHEGYEWGVYRVKWSDHGDLVDVRCTLSDGSDLDAVIAALPAPTEEPPARRFQDGSFDDRNPLSNPNAPSRADDSPTEEPKA